MGVLCVMFSRLCGRVGVCAGKNASKETTKIAFQAE